MVEVSISDNVLKRVRQPGGMKNEADIFDLTTKQDIQKELGRNLRIASYNIHIAMDDSTPNKEVNLVDDTITIAKNISEDFRTYFLKTFTEYRGSADPQQDKILAFGKEHHLDLPTFIIADSSHSKDILQDCGYPDISIPEGEVLVLFELPKPLAQYWNKGDEGQGSQDTGANIIPWGKFYRELTPIIWKHRDNSPENHGIFLSRINENGVHSPGKYYYLWSARYEEPLEVSDITPVNSLETQSPSERIDELLEDRRYDDLTDLCVKVYLKDHPPLDAEFDPITELDKIRALSHKDRLAIKKALALYKERNSRQAGAWDYCQNLIELYINSNPNIPKEDLTNLINHMGQHYGFSNQQIDNADSILEQYSERHRQVLEARTLHPDDKDLIAYLTGAYFYPDSPIKITVGPISIDITAGNLDTNRIYDRSYTASSDCLYGGFAGRRDYGDHEYYTVTNRDTLNNPHGTLVHEHEHAAYFLVQHLLRDYETVYQPEGILHQYRLETNPELAKTVLENRLRSVNQNSYNNAKTEIFSYRKDKNQNPLDNILLGNKIYDYNGSVRSQLLLLLDDPEARKTVRQILVEEYQSTIIGAIDAFDALVSKGHKTVNEAIAHLRPIPLSGWEANVRRTLEATKN